MSRILQLKERKAVLTKEAGEILEAARTEDRDLTGDERGKHDAICQQLDQVNATIEVEERQLKLERELELPIPRGSARGGITDVTVAAPNFEQDPRKGFRTHSDFLLAVIADSGHRDRSQVEDERLRFLAQTDREEKRSNIDLAFMLPIGFTPRPLATVGSDEQGEYSDTYGGYAIQTTRLPGMLQISPEADPTAGRTQRVPMASPTVEILARTDKDHSSYVSGGLTVARRAETVELTPSRMATEMVTMKATGLFGSSFVTEELLADSPISFVAILQTGFRDQFAAHMLNEKLRGLGGAEYLGVLTALASATLGPTITIAEEDGQDDDSITATNVINMAARSYNFGNSIWICNHTCKPQLYVLSIPAGINNVLMYEPSKGDGFPDMLLGRPIFYSEYASAIGDIGDIILGDWSQYLDGLYQPLQSAESVHVRFVNHERAFKFWLRNYGAPWWRTPLTPNKGETLSPFVVLAAR